MGTHVARGRVVEWVAFCLVTGALLFLWLWRGEVMEVETEFGEPRLRVAVVAAAVLAGSASAGYATRSWAAVLAVTIAPLPLLGAWQVVVTVSDGTALWDPSAPGGPALLYAYAVPVSAVASVGVVLGRARGAILPRA